MRRAALLLGLSPALAAGCLETPAGPGAEEDGGGAPDATTGPAACPGLVTNGGFEEGLVAWYADDSVGSPSGTARSGMFGILMCPADSGAEFSAEQVIPLAVEPGQRITASAWVRAAPGSAALVELSLKSHDDAGETVEERYSDRTAQPVDSWRQLAVELKVSVPAARLQIEIEGTASTGDDCFLIDDACVLVE